MTTKTWTRYEVALKGDRGCFSSDGRKASWTPTYNLEDAINHIAELREHVYEGKKIYVNADFVIRTVTTVETEMDYVETTCPVS